MWVACPRRGACQSGEEDKPFEDQWHPKRVRETFPDQEDLRCGCTDSVLSESLQRYGPAFNMRTKTSAER